ncbi:MAG: hypothetical protein ACLUNZ_06880 [Evtepia sp.]
MKRKILALATALALALSLSVCVSAAGQQAGSWTKLSDGYTADTPRTQPTAVPLPDKDTYAITDWVDADHALCVKSLGDKDRAFVVVGRDGSEVTLQFATPTAQIIAAQAGRIAYTNQANDTVYVGRFDGKAALTPVLEEKLGGTLRTRSVQAFNADASKLALVYVPNGTANARNAKLFDLTGGTAKTLSAPQAKADILEVSWLSNGALKVVVEAQGDQPVYTTWQYSEANAAPAGSDLALAQQLNQLGLFRGAGTNADGSVNYDLDRQPNRAEGITMLVRALGAGDQEGTAKNHPYTDVPSWANGVVSYAQKKGLTKGVSATKFGADSPVTTAMYLTFMLRALGYQDGTDFFWNTPWDAAVKAGVLPAQTDWTTLTRGEMVRITTAALFAPVKGTRHPLWQQLVSQGRFTAEQFQAAFPADPYAALHTQSKYRTALAEKLQGVNNVTWMEETSTCTILERVQSGLPHGGYQDELVLVYKAGSQPGEGTVVTLPGVKTTAVRQEAPTSIQCKGTTLTYTYRFDKAVQDVHQAGTYTFTVDLTTGNVSSTVPN